MQIPTWLYAIIMFGAAGGYYWYTVGRRGGAAGYQKHKFGLREGEQTLHMVAGSYIPEKDLKQDIGLALAGVERVGKNLIIALTSQNRLILAHNSDSDPTIHLERDQVSAIHLKGETKLPRWSIVEVHLKDGQQMNLHVDPKGVGPVVAWIG